MTTWKLPNNGKSKYIERFGLSTRYVFVMWCLLGFLIIHILNSNHSMAIIGMVNRSALNVNVNLTSRCYVIKGNATKKVEGKFVWDEKTQGIILGAFYCGYITFQIPGCWLAGKIGGKWVFGLGILGTSVLALISPIAAKFHYGWFLAIRICEGIFESVTFPAVHSMLGRWSPKNEITFMAGIAYSGIAMGTIIGLMTAGFLIENQVMGGWPSVFYIPGMLGTVWFIFWCFLGYSSPDDHPRISTEEKEYIETTINPPKEDVTYNVPWKEMLMSLPVWAVSVANFCAMWHFYLTITSVPRYFTNVIGMSISQSGFITALPHLLSFIFQIVIAKVADFLPSHHYLTITVTRKLFNTVGVTGLAISIILISYGGCNVKLVVSIFCMGSVFSSLAAAGFLISHLDLSTHHAVWVLLGISNTVANIAGIIVPYVVGVLTQHNDSKDQWKIIYFISAAITLFGAIFFLIFASGERQPWAIQKS